MKNNFRKIVIFVLVLCSFIFTNCFKKTDEVSDKTEILTEENEQTTNFLQEIPQIKKTEKQITWKRDRNVDQDDIIHKVWIKSAVDEEGSVVFNENDLFLTVDDGSGDEMVWHLSKVIDGLLGEEKGEYKIISEIAYKIDVGDGSFGVLVLSRYKDNKVYPVILRYVDTLDNKGEINFFQILPFINENTQDIDFNKKNISNVEVFNNKDIVIEYSDETYEHYIPKLIQTSNYNEYKIVKIE